MALTSIIPTDNKVPGAYLQVTLGVGRQSAGANPIRVLLHGNKTSAGSSAVEVVQPLFSKDDARDLFGAGSELFMMAQAAFAANPGVTLFGIATTESVGTSADEDIVLTGGPATAAGSMEVWIGGRRVVAAIASGDTITVAGDAIALAINNETDFPVTAANVAGTITVTAKQAGPKSNAITIRTLLTAATGISHTSLNTVLSGGATDDDPQNALDAVAAERYQYQVASDDASTNLAKFKTSVESKAAPLVGLRERFFFGSRDTLGNATTLSDAVNSKRGQLIWHSSGDDTPAELAAASAALHALLLTSDRARPINSETVPGLRPQNDIADKPLNTELKSALDNGITPLSHNGTDVFIVRSVTNFSTDAQSNPTAAVLDVAKVEVPDFIADTLEANYLTEFQGFKLDDDPADAGDAPQPGVATPKSIKDWIYSILLDYAAGGPQPLLLQRVEEFADQIIVQLDASAQGRANASVPVDVVDGFYQFAGDVKQVG